MTDTGLIPHRTAPLLRGADLDDTYRLAKAVALSRRFPDATTAEQALVKILCGRDLGMTAMQSMMGIHIVEGKPMVSAVTLGAFVRQLPDYDYRVLSHTDEGCAIEFGRGEAPGRDEHGEWLPWPEAFGISSFSMADAEKAGLVKDKSGWKKYPRNMLFARAMSNGVKWYAPDATHGIPVYHDGEIEEAGRFVNGAAEEEPAESVSLSAAIADIPEPFRRRLLDAYADAASLRPGALSPAAIQMSVGGQPLERIEAYIRSIEAANARARTERARAEEPTDAEVVPDDETSPPPDDNQQATRDNPSLAGTASARVAPEPGAAEVDVEALRRELSDLYDRQADVQENPGDETETNAELERIAAQIDDAEAKLLAAGADVPGQEPLL